MKAIKVNMTYGPEQVTPNLFSEDTCAAYWLAQVNLRLRREVAWCWHQRGNQVDPGNGILPPLTDATQDSLDLIRYANEKEEFFSRDVAVSFLNQQIARLSLKADRHSRWQMMADSLQLNEAAQFVLALGLAARLDSALGPVFATCMNDMSRPYPTLALAQRLWSEPLDIIDCAELSHNIYSHGLLMHAAESGPHTIWLQPLNMPAVVAKQLIHRDADLPKELVPVEIDAARQAGPESEVLLAYLDKRHELAARIVPLVGPDGAAFQSWAATLAAQSGASLVRLKESDISGVGFRALACVCWLRGWDIVLPDKWMVDEQNKSILSLLESCTDLPVHWYLPLTSTAKLTDLPRQHVTPVFHVPALTFDSRVKKLVSLLGEQANEIMPCVEECARRYRLEEQAIERVAQPFRDGRTRLTVSALYAACANEAVLELGNLAQKVKPRFVADELILPPQHKSQFEDIVHAMQVLTLVHYHWGTARVWNEGGLSVLFYGAPGTGKTMAAEALAAELKLPMFRVDLSQVVNKYVGETEKNLKRIFDAAEMSECLLFFDEADAIFGKRTDVKDAHDRFANIETSYLLERMERFKGLAILATNRRKDIDEAFMRRLRFVMEFPIPALAESKRIWASVFPDAVDISELDLHYLAKQFQLSGGHIRSIAFNACLRAARNQDNEYRKVTMPDLLLSLKRELEKMERSADVESFGHYSKMLREVAE